MKFLEDENASVKKQYESIFTDAVAKAKRFASNGFIEITEVKLDDAMSVPADWSPAGVIRLRRDAQPESLYHEVFHSVFHPSVLHDSNGEDPRYGDTFCNAFRHFASGEKVGWMQQDGSAYDATRLVAKAKDLASFLTYWNGLCERKKSGMRRLLDTEDIK